MSRVITKKVTGVGIRELGKINQCRIEIDVEIQGVDSKDKVKCNERTDQLFFSEDGVGGRARVTADEERVLRGR